MGASEGDMVPSALIVMVVVLGGATADALGVKISREDNKTREIIREDTVLVFMIPP
jgi:hypothetical protein